MGYKDTFDIPIHQTNYWRRHQSSVHPKVSLTTKSIEYSNKVAWLAPDCNVTNDPWLSATNPAVRYVLELAKYYPLDILYPGKCLITYPIHLRIFDDICILLDHCGVVQGRSKPAKYRLMFEDNQCEGYIQNFDVHKGITSIPIGKGVCE